ncbi:hypothetical protein KIN20_026501 [Parelaphostrongylus tenuis]|uniref:Uncharacterized protein n=1 Tax=Parelaphostrongylus tenuis TaxID=148309 RepID=A0AAD5WD43_PARTN|nr:hypothetical protein KIN20_026501 [Parelaphostrongylus tenuis]
MDDENVFGKRRNEDAYDTRDCFFPCTYNTKTVTSDIKLRTFGAGLNIRFHMITPQGTECRKTGMRPSDEGYFVFLEARLQLRFKALKEVQLNDLMTLLPRAGGHNLHVPRKPYDIITSQQKISDK